MSVDQLRKSPMMSHLLDALEQGEDIGHYGRLIFAMVGQHFLDKQEIADWLSKGSGADEGDIKAMIQGVEERDYNPPSRQKVLRWQEDPQQEFMICPTPDDPNACNVYQELDLPDEVYEHIEEYREEQFERS